MRPSALAALWLLGAAAAAQAQPAPFDMTPERPVDAPAPAASQPAPAAPPAPVPPTAVPAAPSPPTAPSPPPAPPAETEVAAPADGAWRRYLVAAPRLSLAGEIDRRRWSTYLTREEAGAPATFRLGYQNAILVAPEPSRLRVFVNDTLLIEEVVASSDAVKDLAVPVPDGLLRPGFNTLTAEVSLRHRTDCTLASTYDLWTEIESGRTFLEFSGAPADFAPRRLDDLRAAGVDADGATRIRLTLPEGDLAPAAETVLRLSQALALIAAMPNPAVEIRQGEVPPAAPGTLDVALGPSEALAALLPETPGGIEAAGGTGFARRSDGTALLVVTGSAWSDVENGAERVAAFAERLGAAPRAAISNPAVRSPDAPMMRERGSLRFADLGVPSQEFAGRRFRTEFALAVPGDFFAEAYGEALLRLDAAYSGEILPGSQINIYVNGNIATTLPIGGGGSGVLDAFPLKMTMRHLRPGANTLALEASLLTEADAACLPGATANEGGRFAIFDTSGIEIPDFARIARVPDLAATGGVGFPYSLAQEPVAVFLPDERAEGLGAAANVLSRIAFAAGRVVPVDAGGSRAVADAGHALFVGTPRQLPADVLAQVNVDPAQAALWGGQAPSAEQSTGLTLERWREQFVAEDGWRATLRATEAWIRSTFDIEAGGLRLLPAEDPPFAPGAEAQLLVAQGEGPAPGSVWTVVSAPTVAALGRGIGDLVREDGWRQLAGRVATLGSDGALAAQPVGDATFVRTQPLTVANLRLIVANWLSENVLSYATLIVLAALLLGLSTTAFVRSLGQR